MPAAEAMPAARAGGLRHEGLARAVRALLRVEVRGPADRGESARVRAEVRFRSGKCIFPFKDTFLRVLRCIDAKKEVSRFTWKNNVFVNAAKIYLCRGRD